jgi:hypothetical protein
VTAPVRRAVGARVLCVVAATAIAGGCSTQTANGAPCYPGDYVYCPCDGGVQGYSQCPTDGGDYGACNCSGIHPTQVDATALVCNLALGVLPLLCPCTMDDQCQSGQCFPFNAKGPHCTTSCNEQNASTVCPPASGGCSNMGVCMAP